MLKSFFIIYIIPKLSKKYKVQTPPLAFEAREEMRAMQTHAQVQRIGRWCKGQERRTVGRRSVGEGVVDGDGGTDAGDRSADASRKG